jgi:hypothetical protein
MARPETDSTIDDYLRQRLMPVEGTIPHIPGIEIYGNSISAGTVGGDLFEYINFQQLHFLDYPDKEINELGARGIGEIGLAGVAAAVTAAVHHATGVRVRELPIKIEDLLTSA